MWSSFNQDHRSIFVQHIYQRPTKRRAKTRTARKPQMNHNPSHERRATELASPSKPNRLSGASCVLSTLGIGLLGLGVGAITAPYFRASAARIALLGLTVHLIALIHTARTKHPASSAGRLWLTAIYGSCWIILLVLTFALLRTWLVHA